jgi:hypothetical protein
MKDGLTSQPQFRAALRALPVVTHEALVHSAVRPGHAVHTKHLLGQQTRPGTRRSVPVRYRQHRLGVA